MPGFAPAPPGGTVEATMLAAKVTPKNRMATYDWPPRMKKSLQKNDNLDPGFSRIFPNFCHVKKIFYEGQISGVKGEFNEHHFLSSSRFRRLVKLEKPMLGALSAQVTGVKHPTRNVFLSRMAVDARRCQSAMICWPILPPRNTGSMHGEQPILTLDLQMFFSLGHALLRKYDAKYRHDQHDCHCSPLMESVLG